MPVQRSLFPDAFELQSAALAALRDLDFARAAEQVQRARRLDPRLVNLEMIEEALRFLEARLARGVTPEHLASALLEAGSGALDRPVAAFVDEVLSRYVERHWPAAAPFVDREARVPRGMLDLVLGQAERAREGLTRLVQGELEARADLWGYLGDACCATQRPQQANACYVRALLLDVARLDLWRIREPRLAALHERLAAQHSAALARELLPSQAWLEGCLHIPEDNGWLDGHLSRLQARAPAGASSPEQRARRFALLLYLDRSTPPRAADLGRREEMAALEPERFAAYMRECGARERA